MTIQEQDSGRHNFATVITYLNMRGCGQVRKREKSEKTVKYKNRKYFFLFWRLLTITFFLEYNSIKLL